MEKLLLRVAEAAALVSLSRSKGYELVASGEWPSVKIGRAVRVPSEGLRMWVAQQTRRASYSDSLFDSQQEQTPRKTMDETARRKQLPRARR